MSTKIEWTDETWNPTVGCTKVSPGCDHCYAETMHERFNGKGSFATVAVKPNRVNLPLTWRKPRRIFVNSMSDLFHADVPTPWIAEVFAVMAAAPRHTFQVLTKRHARMRSLLSDGLFRDAVADRMMGKTGKDRLMPQWPLPNVWLGVSVESQQWADIRIPALLATPAAVRFLSCEPLLGPVDLSEWLTDWSQNGASGYEPWHGSEDGLHWVIVGGESGHGARLMQLDWARSIRDQCQGAGVPFLFKQFGEWVPTNTHSLGYVSDPRERQGEPFEDERFPGWGWRRLYQRVGKKAAGRDLDGRTWDEYPAVSA